MNTSGILGWNEDPKKKPIDLGREDIFGFFAETTNLNVDQTDFQRFINDDGINVTFSDFSNGNPTGFVEMNVYGLDGGNYCVRLFRKGDPKGGIGITAAVRQVATPLVEDDCLFGEVLTKVRTLAPTLKRHELPRVDLSAYNALCAA
jgi:hypothetical protein